MFRPVDIITPLPSLPGSATGRTLRSLVMVIASSRKAIVGTLD